MPQDKKLHIQINHSRVPEEKSESSSPNAFSLNFDLLGTEQLETLELHALQEYYFRLHERLKQIVSNLSKQTQAAATEPNSAALLPKGKLHRKTDSHSRHNSGLDTLFTSNAKDLIERIEEICSIMRRKKVLETQKMEDENAVLKKERDEKTHLLHQIQDSSKEFIEKITSKEIDAIYNGHQKIFKDLHGASRISELYRAINKQLRSSRSKLT
ncbi:MAG: hypothetical protein ACKOAD_05625, partial [Gammaproteobacteria bacterium]